MTDWTRIAAPYLTHSNRNPIIEGKDDLKNQIPQNAKPEQIWLAVHLNQPLCSETGLVTSLWLWVSQDASLPSLSRVDHFTAHFKWRSNLQNYFFFRFSENCKDNPHSFHIPLIQFPWCYHLRLPSLLTNSSLEALVFPLPRSFVCSRTFSRIPHCL